MRVRVGLVLVFLVAAVPLAFPVAAAATMPGTASAELLAANEPAVEAPPEAADDEEQPWTARYLAPGVLVLGIVALAGSALYYGVRIRGKYRVS
jgi:hypothetical protein